MRTPNHFTMRPEELHAYVYSERVPGDFFTDAGGQYLLGIATFLAADPSRPECTPANVGAIILEYPIRLVCRQLATEPAAAVVVQAILSALEQKADKQVAAILPPLQQQVAKWGISQADRDRVNACMHAGL